MLDTEKLTKIDDSLYRLVDFPYLDNNFDSLNEYEELCLLLEKLNETIDQVNVLTEKIDEGTYDPSELIAMINQVKTDLEGEINTLNVNLTKKINDLETSTDGKLAELQSSLTAKIEEVQETLNNNINQVNQTLTTKIEEVNTNLTTEIERVNTDLNGKIEANTSLINSNKTATDESISTLSTKVDEVSTNVAGYDTKINDLTTKVDNVETTVAGYDADILKLKNLNNFEKNSVYTTYIKDNYSLGNAIVDKIECLLRGSANENKTIYTINFSLFVTNPHSVEGTTVTNTDIRVENNFFEYLHRPTYCYCTWYDENNNYVGFTEVNVYGGYLGIGVPNECWDKNKNYRCILSSGYLISRDALD